MMMKADTAIDEAFKAGRVPPGITPEHLNESRDRPAVVGIIFVAVLTSVILAGRCLSRIFLVKRFGLDDGLAILSWFIFIPVVVLSILLIKAGAGRHFEYVIYVLDTETLNYVAVVDFVDHLLYTTSLVICRLSGLAFFGAIAKQHDRYTRAVRLAAGVIFLCYVPQLFLIVFHCIPVTGLWPFAFQPEAKDYKCLTWGVVYGVNSAVSLFADLIVYGVPTWMLSTLEMNGKRKIQLGCILLPGVLVTFLSISRLVLVIRGQWLIDMSWSYNPMLAVEVAEIGGTLISLSVPGIKPLVDRLVVCKRRSSGAEGEDQRPKRNLIKLVLNKLRLVRHAAGRGESTREESSPGRTVEFNGEEDDNQTRIGGSVALSTKLNKVGPDFAGASGTRHRHS